MSPFLVGQGSQGIATPIPAAGGLGHHFEVAPDGNEYFAVLGPSLNLIYAVRDLIEAQRIAVSIPEGGGKPQAEAIAVIIAELQTAVEASGVATARFAQSAARSNLEKRIVRPATDNPTHLVESIIARAVVIGNDSPETWGAVGIGDISVLDKHPYWKAQEFGSTHLVGKSIRGFFFDQFGQAFAPSPSDFRAHPMFAPSSQAPTMHVENPIQGKAFLAQATIDALEFRHRAWRNIEKASVAQMRAVRTGTSGEFAGAAYSATVGGFARLARLRGL